MQVHCSLKHWKGESLMGDIDLHLHENTLECKFVAFCYTKQKKSRRRRESTHVRADNRCEARQIAVGRCRLGNISIAPYPLCSRLSLDANRRQFVHRPPELAVLSLTSFLSFVGVSWSIWGGSLICFAALNWLSRVFDVGPLRRLFGEKTFGNRKRTQKSFRHEKNIFFFCVREHTLNKETSVFCCSFAKYSFLMFSGSWLCASPMMLSWN